MSGGSFNYFCYDSVGSGALDNLDDLRDMESYCRKLGKHEAADELYEYLLFLETVERRMAVQHKRIQNLCRAVEWEASGDIGIEGIDIAYRKLIGSEDGKGEGE